MLRLIKTADDGTLGHHRRNLYQIYMMFMREGGIMPYWYWVRSTPQREDKVPQNKSANIFKGEWKEIQIQILFCIDSNIVENLLSHFQA